MKDRLHTVRLIRKGFAAVMLFPASVLLMIAGSIVTVSSIWTDIVLWIA